MKHIITALMIIICGSVSAQIYTPETPTVYGIHQKRDKVDSARHVPEKSALTTNTLDTSAQIFYYKVDSSMYGYSKAKGFFRIGDGGSGGGGVSITDTIFLSEWAELDSLSHPGKQTILVRNSHGDSIIHKGVYFPGVNPPDGYFPSYDSTNNRFIFKLVSGTGTGTGISKLGSPSYGLIRINDSTYIVDTSSISSIYQSGTNYSFMTLAPDSSYVLLKSLSGKHDTITLSNTSGSGGSSGGLTTSAGTNTPTTTSINGVTTSASSSAEFYSQVGTIVTVSGYGLLTSNGSAANGGWNFSLPITSNGVGASTVIGAGTVISSYGSSVTRYPGQVTVGGGTNPATASFSFLFPVYTSGAIQFTYTYQYQIRP